MVAEMPDRFSRVVVSNTGMVAGEGIKAWFSQQLIKFMIWWNGPITFEELKIAADEALNSENPLQVKESLCFRNGWLILITPKT